MIMMAMYCIISFQIMIYEFIMRHVFRKLGSLEFHISTGMNN